MTRPIDAHPALPPLVERLTTFLRAQAHTEPPPPIAAAPDDLAPVLDALGHHIVVLTLVARSDNNILDKEREVIFDYCVRRAEQIGRPLTAGGKQALTDYLSSFYPQLVLLENALERLKYDSKDSLEALLEAAHDVIGADHIYRVDEVAFLLSLRDDLAAL